MTGLVWSERPPTPEEYVALRAAADLGPRCLAAAERALPNGLYTVTVRDRDRLVAMGRVIGDGGAFVQIVDVAVLPAYQGAGLGRGIMTRLMTWCESSLPGTCHVSLVSSERAEPLYAQFGFRPARGMDRNAAPGG